jgi:hypothetical protein
MLKLWQELHEIKPDFERRGSKNNFFPNSTIEGFLIFGASRGFIGSPVRAAAARASAEGIIKENRENKAATSFNMIHLPGSFLTSLFVKKEGLAKTKQALVMKHGKCLPLSWVSPKICMAS